MFNLSGAINVLLFLNTRRQLLLFPRPDNLSEPDMKLQVSSQGPSLTILPDIANFQDSPEQPSAALPVDERSVQNSPTQFRVNSRRIPVEV
jgi:hypothetical protein